LTVSSEPDPTSPDHPTRVAFFLFAAMPVLASIVAGVFASTLLVASAVGGLWMAWRQRAFGTLAAIGGLALLAGLVSTLGNDTVTELVLFSASIVGAVVCLRLARCVTAADRARAATVFVACTIALPVIVLAHGLIRHPDLIPPWSLTPDLLAKHTFVAMTLVIPATYLLWRSRQRALAVLFLAFMAVMAVGSASSTATLAFFLSLATLVLARIRPALGVAVLVGVLVAPLVASVAIQVAGITDWSTIGLRMSWTYRLELWQRALVLFQEAPLFGHGLDSYADIAPHLDLGPLDLHLGRFHPHSVLMQLLAEGGLTAVAAFGLLVRLIIDRPRLTNRDQWAVRLAALAAAFTPPAIGVNLWSDYTFALVLYPWLACALFLDHPDEARPLRHTGGRRSP